MKLINANGYGFVIVPVSTFEQFRKEQKIKAKKMLTYFAKNNVMGDAFLQNGCMLPIAHINYGEYAIFIDAQQSNIPQDWKIIKEWKSFNLCVDDDNSIWVVSLDNLEAWDVAGYQGKEFCQQENIFDINDNLLERYNAIRYNVPKGKYEATVIGLKKEGTEDAYGFSIVLTPTITFIQNADASETAFNDIFQTS